MPRLLYFFVLQFLVACAQQQFVQNISTASDIVTVDFQFFSIRSPNFGVLVQDDTGSFFASPATPYRTYLGTVRGHPGAMASGLLKANGTLLCRISFENGIEWSSTGGVASIRNTKNWKPRWPTTLVSPTSNSNSVIFVAEVGVDATYLEYAAAGYTVQDVIDIVEFSILAANVPFLRDASILHKIGKVVIRTSQSRDPYGTSKDTSFLLNTVKNQWNNVISTVVGKTQHLALVVQPEAPGGLAWVSNIATSLAYSANGADANGDFSIIWRHEAGHNWGSNHYEGGGQPEGPTIMSDNQLSRFSSSELAKILAYKSRVSQLASNMSIPRPPRANMDRASFQCRLPLHVDVLANDLDADINGLQINSVENPSAMDSTIQISRSLTGRDQIVYTCSPSSPAAALFGDFFSYSIKNIQGRTSTGYVTLRPAALVSRWKMDETSGLTVQDSSGNAASGTITGSTTWNQGSGGLAFKGAGMVSFGTSPSLQGTTSFSISVWVRMPANAATSSNEVIIQQRSPPSTTTNGYNGEYQLYLLQGKPSFWVFGNSADQFRFSASAAIDDNEWHHLVAIRDDREGRIYIDGKLSGSASGQVRNLDGTIPVFMGWDSRDNISFLTGTLMEAKIYNRALDLDEVTYLSTRPEALVGWWKLDDKSGISAKDSSWNAATGTIVGSTTWNQEDAGLNFDGAGKVLLGTGPSLKGKTSFSIHAWVKIPKDAVSMQVIIQQRSAPSSTTNGYNGEYQLYLLQGKPSFWVFGQSADQFRFSASTAINDGKWHHIVAMRDQTEGRIYIDGKLSGSATGEVRNLDANIPVFMGFDDRDRNSFLTGSLKGVKIYNQAVTAFNLPDKSTTTTMLLAAA